MVHIKVRYKNIVSSYIHDTDNDSDAIFTAMKRFKLLFNNEFKFICSAKIKENPFKLKKQCVGIRELVLDEHLS